MWIKATINKNIIVRVRVRVRRPRARHKKAQQVHWWCTEMPRARHKKAQQAHLWCPEMVFLPHGEDIPFVEIHPQFKPKMADGVPKSSGELTNMYRWLYCRWPVWCTDVSYGGNNIHHTSFTRNMPWRWTTIFLRIEFAVFAEIKTLRL